MYKRQGFDFSAVNFFSAVSIQSVVAYRQLLRNFISRQRQYNIDKPIGADTLNAQLRGGKYPVLAVDADIIRAGTVKISRRMQ